MVPMLTTCFNPSPDIQDLGKSSTAGSGGGGGGYSASSKAAAVEPIKYYTADELAKKIWYS